MCAAFGVRGPRWNDRNTLHRGIVKRLGGKDELSTMVM